MKKVLAIVVAAVAVGGLAVGCGDDDDGGDASGNGDEANGSIYDGDSRDDGDDGTGGAASGAATLAVADTSLGEVLVDGDGYTLYLFTQDDGDERACTEGCLQIWPPVTSDGDPEVGEGVDESLVGVATLPDGTEQVTYAGNLLYTYAQDEAPGDVNGQGVPDWFAVLATGEPASG